MADEPSEPNPDPQEERDRLIKPGDETEEEEGGPVKSFLEHLEDLRWVLIKIIASVMVSMTICLIAADKIVKFLEWPLVRSGLKVDVKSLTGLGPFVSAMKISFWGGICLSLPYILFVIGQFVMPALKKNEKPYFRKAFTIGGGLFFIGMTICYGFVMPIAFAGLGQFAEWIHIPMDMWQADDYFQTVVMFMLGMGLSFEIPVIILTLRKMGIISHELMAKSRMYFFIINMVVCAFITPDALSTVFMVLPVQVLFEVCLIISKSWLRKERIAEAKRRELDRRD
jgi:sec-independent protein translocase protein TatC